MALTETPSTWVVAAHEGFGPGMPILGTSVGGTATQPLRPVLAALAASPFDVEGTTRVGAIDPSVRQWRADAGVGATTIRQNRWVEAH
jgi:hypothetical protein